MHALAVACLFIPMVAMPAWFAVWAPAPVDTAETTKRDNDPPHSTKKLRTVQEPGDKKPGTTAKPGSGAEAPDVRVAGEVAVADTDTVVFMGLGDLLFDRQVAATMKRKGAEEPFADVKGILQPADFVAGNLEAPLSSRGTPVEGKDYTFRGLPEAAVAMKSSGIDAVALANDHIMDYGPEALADTMGLLDGVGIAHAGAGVNERAAYAPAIVTVKGKKIAFFSYTSVLPDGSLATAGKPGVASTRITWEYLQGVIKEAQEQNDYVVVSVHWGKERSDYPEKYQRTIARKAIDAGADIVVGHHPQVIQGVEIYKGKPIAYSLGGFVFDHFSRRTGETFIFRVDLAHGSPAKVEIIPVYIDYYGKPKVLTGQDAKYLLGRIKTISAPFKTQIDIVGDRGRVGLEKPVSPLSKPAPTPPQVPPELSQPTPPIPPSPPAP